jgi:hypothetical protein
MFPETTMRGFLFILAACGAMLGAKAVESQPGPGWPDVFPPAPPNYFLAYDPPVVAKGDDPVVYRQTARYDWLGNDYRSGTATMARDPKFKTKYSTEAMKKEGSTETKVGKKTAWLRPLDGPGVKPQRELIVPLSEDKALILTSRGNFGEQELEMLASRFNLEQVETALAKPPHGDGKKE